MLRINDISLTPPPPGWGVRLDGKLISAGTYPALSKAIWTHQRAVGQPYWTDAQIQDCLCRELQKRYPGANHCDTQDRPFFADIDALPSARSSDTFGPVYWRLLHAKRISQEANPGQWVNAFHAKIPCPECRNHFADVIQQVPPDYTSDEAFFACGVVWHNFVNRSLGKPQWTLEQAKEFYGY